MILKKIYPYPIFYYASNFQSRSGLLLGIRAGIRWSWWLGFWPISVSIVETVLSQGTMKLHRPQIPPTYRRQTCTDPETTMFNLKNFWHRGKYCAKDFLRSSGSSFLRSVTTYQNKKLTRFSIIPFRDLRSILKYPKMLKQSSSSANSKLASIAKYTPDLPPPSLEHVVHDVCKY